MHVLTATTTNNYNALITRPWHNCINFDAVKRGVLGRVADVTITRRSLAVSEFTRTRQFCAMIPCIATDMLAETARCHKIISVRLKGGSSTVNGNPSQNIGKLEITLTDHCSTEFTILRV